MTIDKETIEKFKQANASNIAKKLREGKTLSSAESKMLKEYERGSIVADETKAKSIIAEGLAIMHQIANIIDCSLLSKEEKQSIKDKIYSLNAK